MKGRHAWEVIWESVQDFPMTPSAATFAVIECSPQGKRVLVLLDTEVEAEAIAIELRRNGYRVEVQRGPC